MQTPSKRTAKFTGQSIRPTADRAREALFSIIGREIEGGAVLDLYAGTGALGLEALSRAAQRAVFVDSNPQAVQLIEKNIKICGFSHRSLVLKRDLSKGLYFLGKLLPGLKFSIIFIDPPYRKGLSATMLSEIEKENLLSRDALVVVEDNAISELPETTSGLGLVDRRRYGETGFWFYRRPKQVQE
ncbi:MAG: 16S rRNA (guanine(966)-N(2))-methyltransferase RsmD [Deltaproteobacteria bacterium]|nr:16S rRNA (guanine(966)-N(2))-methyltransferase RsmD [Deltaproteobacteria bacterium]